VTPKRIDTPTGGSKAPWEYPYGVSLNFSIVIAGESFFGVLFFADKEKYEERFA
jgi:hypothetical protein